MCGLSQGHSDCLVTSSQSIFARSHSFTVEAQDEETKDEEANKKRVDKGKRKVLKVLSTPHKHNSERTIDMALVQYVFAESVERYYNHNKLKRFMVREQAYKMGYRKRSKMMVLLLAKATWTSLLRRLMRKMMSNSISLGTP